MPAANVLTYNDSSITYSQSGATYDGLGYAFDERGRFFTALISETGRLRVTALEENGFHLYSMFVAGIVVADDITVTEHLTLQGLNIRIETVEDTVAVSELYTSDVFLALHYIDVNEDPITVSEFVDYSISWLVSEYDSLTISEEYAWYFDVLNVIGTELISITETIDRYMGIAFSVVNTVAITEWQRCSVNVLDIDLGEDVTVSEYVNLLDIGIELGIVDVVAISEFYDLYLDVLYKSVEETIGVTENHSQYLDVLNFQPIQNVTVTENFVPELRINIDVLDNDIAVTEFARYDVAWIPYGFDNIAVSESAGLFIFAMPLRNRPVTPFKPALELNPKKVSIQLQPVKKQVVLYPREGVTVS